MLTSSGLSATVATSGGETFTVAGLFPESSHFDPGSGQDSRSEKQGSELWNIAAMVTAVFVHSWLGI